MKMKGVTILGVGMILGAMTMATVVPNLDRRTNRKINKMGRNMAGKAEDLCYSIFYNRM